MGKARLMVALLMKGAPFKKEKIHLCAKCCKKYGHKFRAARTAPKKKCVFCD